MAEAYDVARSLADQETVFQDALVIMHEREKRYKGLWRESGAPDNLRQVKHKIARVLSGLEHCGVEGDPLPGDELDDAYDALNYLAFAIRNAQEGRFEDRT